MTAQTCFLHNGCLINNILDFYIKLDPNITTYFLNFSTCSGPPDFMLPWQPYCCHRYLEISKNLDVYMGDAKLLVCQRIGLYLVSAKV